MSDLRANQKKAIEALAKGATVEMAALQAGVNPKTVHQWKRENEAFRGELQAVTETILNDSITLLTSATWDSITTLIDIRDDLTATQNTRMTAARYIIESMIRLTEFYSLVERVSALERRASDDRNFKPY